MKIPMTILPQKASAKMKAYMIKDGMPHESHTNGYKRWFRQSYIDAKVNHLFFSGADRKLSLLLDLVHPYPLLDTFAHRVMYLMRTLKVDNLSSTKENCRLLKDAYVGKGIVFLASNNVPEVIQGIFMLATSTGLFCEKCKKIVSNKTALEHDSYCADSLEHLPKIRESYGIDDIKKGVYECLTC